VTASEREHARRTLRARAAGHREQRAHRLALEAGVRDIEERYYGWPAFLRRTSRLRRYPALLRPANLLLYATVNLQYVASLRRRRRGVAINTGGSPPAHPLPAAG